MISPKELDALAAKVAKATAGEWKWDAGDVGIDYSKPYCDVYVWRDEGELIIAGINELDNEEGRANAQAIVALRNAADSLIAAARREARLRDRPKIVCLCGSTRFIREMACIMWALERDEGYICLGMHLLPDSYPGVQPDHMAEHEGRKDHFDELHKRKIDLADEVLVLNIGGYIGESTRSEIEYAEKHGKPVRYLEARRALAEDADG